MCKHGNVFSLAVLIGRGIILSIATLLGCVSCHTIGGVGKDVEAVGSDINSAARSTSRSM